MLTSCFLACSPHRDAYLPAEEQTAHDPFTPCCSRARCERLVLDL
ncbi:MULTISPECIES: hypothetical protein [Delftia]|nr:MULTISPECIES: hypothetical protein [Delftia]MCX7508888.1 hypothetical protein [Delftia tsuruhatensis]